MVVENFLELIDIDDVVFTDEYVNMVDISVDQDESFLLGNGIISHNSAGGAARQNKAQNQGFFLLKGKFANVSKMSDKDILNNKEVVGLMNSLGLEINQKLDVKNLRFGEILIATDSDVDGDSITALLFNFFGKWKELYDLNMIYKVLTPLLVITKNKESKYFYNEDEWTEYQKNNSIKGWEVFYKKGLGSLTIEQYKEMMENTKKVLIKWDENTENLLNVWFGNDSNLRKEHLL